MRSYACAASAFFLGLVISGQTFAQTAPGQVMSRFEAYSIIQGVLAENPPTSNCGHNNPLRFAERPTAGNRLQVDGVVFGCPPGPVANAGVSSFRCCPDIAVGNNGTRVYFTNGRVWPMSIDSMSTPNAQAFVDAWRRLAQGPVALPQEDVGFRGAASQAGDDAEERTEALRRAQVRAEAHLEGDRALDAALTYYEALKRYPDWAAGRYNLGLVAGRLGLYPEAITEMRRYLHLEPNAPDARSAQDQIYRWEAEQERAAQTR